MTLGQTTMVGSGEQMSGDLEESQGKQEFEEDRSKADAPVTHEVFFSFEAMPLSQQDWDQFIVHVGGDIYLTYDWCRVWWRYYGEGRSLRIFVFRQGGGLAAIVPMFIDRVRLGPVAVRLAKVVGSDFTMIMADCPVVPEYSRQVWQQVVTDLMQNAGCDAVLAGPLADRYGTREALLSLCSGSSHLRVVRDNIRSMYTEFNLPEGFEQYLASLEKRQRTNYRRDVSLIEKSFAVTTDVVTQEDHAAHEFEPFLKMHEAQWQAEGRLGHFADWPSGELFNRDLAIAQAARGRLRLIRLCADGQVVSYQLCFAFGGRLLWRLTARIVGQGWERFGLGRLGMFKMIETTLSQGIRYVDAGAGHYDYKIKAGGVEKPLYCILLASNKYWSRIRLGSFRAMADLLHLLYYRIWFGRVAPRLPLKRGPLWRSWTRSRL